MRHQIVCNPAEPPRFFPVAANFFADLNSDLSPLRLSRLYPPSDHSCDDSSWSSHRHILTWLSALGLVRWRRGGGCLTASCHCERFNNPKISPPLFLFRNHIAACEELIFYVLDGSVLHVKDNGTEHFAVRPSRCLFCSRLTKQGFRAIKRNMSVCVFDTLGDFPSFVWLLLLTMKSCLY